MKRILLSSLIALLALPLFVFAAEITVVPATPTVAAGGDPANPGSFVVVPGTPCYMARREEGTDNILLVCDYGVDTLHVISGVMVSVPAGSVKVTGAPYTITVGDVAP